MRLFSELPSYSEVQQKMTAVFTVGQVVQLVGLVSSQSLNGAVGTVIRDLDYESRGRHGVGLQSPAAAVAAHPCGISLSPKNLIKVRECSEPDCNENGRNACSACMKEFYCSAKCQKTDWKIHKIVCPLMKLMSDVLVPFIDVSSTIDKVLAQTEEQIVILGNKRYVRLLHYAAAFAGHQFGKRIPGTKSYSRDSGEWINNWGVEILALYAIYKKLSHHNSSFDDDGNVKDCWTNKIPYLQKSLVILEPWDTLNSCVIG